MNALISMTIITNILQEMRCQYAQSHSSCERKTLVCSSQLVVALCCGCWLPKCLRLDSLGAASDTTGEYHLAFRTTLERPVPTAQPVHEVVRYRDTAGSTSLSAKPVCFGMLPAGQRKWFVVPAGKHKAPLRRQPSNDARQPFLAMFKADLYPSVFTHRRVLGTVCATRPPCNFQCMLCRLQALLFSANLSIVAHRELPAHFGLTQKTVQLWFQNQRQRNKCTKLRGSARQSLSLSKDNEASAVPAHENTASV
eukprot:5072225-Pleurochrysis_carterae.AAC.4